jgi:hypothetical protein
MRLKHVGRGRRAASLAAMGCLLGAGTVGGTALAPATPAFASCSSFHTNVDGYDTSGNYYGNKAFIYVNTNTVINGLQSAIFRNLFVVSGAGDDVEVGWTANNGGHSNPTVYAEWVNRGVDSGPQYYTGYSLSTDTDYRFFAENVGHIDIFRFYVDGESSPFNYSPTMNFNTGEVLTNSEHYNTCDSLYTHMYALGHMRSDGSWHDYDNLACYYNNSGGNWLFEKNSNTELHVDQTTGSAC